MNYSDFRFTLDIQIHQAQVSVPVTFGDSARRLCIGLTDGRKPYVIKDGCIAVFNAKKPDGTKLKNACIIERNVILYEFTEQTANAEGIVYCDITLYGVDGKVLTSPQFTIVVDKRVVRDTEVAVSEDQYTALDNIFTYEAQRQSQEEQRIANEELREILEKNRDDSETQRKANEVSRLNAEGDRTVAEGKRVAAENQRQSQEEQRIANEEQRKANEEQRKINETSRANAETSRANAEANRVGAENQRMANETNREKRFAEMVGLDGDIHKALDAILAIQESLIGGDA